MLRVDLAARTLRASVRAIAEALPQAGTADSPLGAARARLGAEAHRAWQARAAQEVPGFRSEVAVAGRLSIDGFDTHVRGRIDGVVRDVRGALHVEEVKSIASEGAAFDALRAADLPEARLQLRLYAWLLARAHPDVPVRARLVLVSVLDGTRRVLDVAPRPARTEQVLVRRLRRVIRTATDRAARARRAAEPAARLRFPYAEARPHQRAMQAFVGASLAAGRPALVEAPTGIGKTAAALVPALEHARRHGALLYVLTAKRTQRARAAATFEDVVAASGPAAGALRALTLRPRTAMCPPGTLDCHPRRCRYLANVGRKAEREDAVQALLRGPAHVDPDAVFALGRARTLCPYVLARRLCARVDLAIGDYNHVYGGAEPPGRFPGEVLPRPVVVVLDEAHNLFDRARAYDTPFLARRDIEALLARQAPAARRRTLPLFDACEDPAADLDARTLRFLHALRACLDRTLEAAPDPTFPDGCAPAGAEDAAAWEPLAARGARLAIPYARRLAARGLPARDDPLLGLVHTVGRVRDLLARDDPALVPYVSLAERGARGLGLGICCVDPSRRLAARHRALAGVVAMSATLTPLPHYASVLGLDGLQPETVRYGSPFPVEQRCVAVVPSVQTTWRARRHHVGAIARLIERTIAVQPGHYVAFFPSFAFLAAVRARLAVEPAALLEQTPRMDDGARERVLERLATDPAPLLLLAVSGGIFAEGVDLPGKALIGVLVVGPALPRVGFERAAMAQHFEREHGDGFARAMLLPGMQRVVQAAGRVHRTPEDRGVIVLLGRRFTQAPYAASLPAHWSRYGLEEAITDDPVPRLHAFWHGTHGT